jgi:probable F420-dependent oxidoreductase
MMDFGITFKSDMGHTRMVQIARQAEAAGFGYIWAFDSHVLWQEAYTLLTVCALNTKKMKLGPCVTNPRVRDWTLTASILATLQKISGGRMQMGIGRGDSSRRVLGKKPTTLEVMEECIQYVRDLTGGKKQTYDGTEIQLPWADGGVPPVWVAGYGPKALRAAGRVADGVILQFADPHLIKWCLGFVKEGAQEAGRDYSKIQVMSASATFVSNDLEKARDKVRWFPALVSNHVVDLVSKYDPAQLPQELTAYVRDRQGYNYLHHAEVGSSNAQFVSDEIVDRYCVIGPPKEQIRRLEELRDLGVTQYNIYLMCTEEEKQVAAYGREVIPHFNRKSVRVAKPAAKKKTAKRSAHKKTRR